MLDPLRNIGLDTRNIRLSQLSMLNTSNFTDQVSYYGPPCIKSASLSFQTQQPASSEQRNIRLSQLSMLNRSNITDQVPYYRPPYIKSVIISFQTHQSNFQNIYHE